MEGEPGIAWPYKEAVGSLMWMVVWSRLEIANATRAVARHTNKPTERHSKRYFKSSSICSGRSICVSRSNGDRIWICRCTRIPTTQRRPTTGGLYRG